MHPPPLTIDNLRRLAPAIPVPSNLARGLLCERSLAPDNIVLHRRELQPRPKSEGVGTHYHHRFELALVLEQAGPVRIDQTSFQLNPADAVLIFPNQFHHYLDLGGACEWLFITFDLHNPDAIRELRDRPRTLDQPALSLAEFIVSEFVTPSPAGPDTLSIAYHLSRLLRRLLVCPELPAERRNIHASESARDVILDKINKYVREHLGEAINISDIASHLGYSVSHLRAVFRDRLGVSLGRFMRESRLSEAARLLQTSPLNVSAIGERCGFESLYAFSRAFRKSYGAPPRAYRHLVVEGRALPARSDSPAAVA